MKSKNVSQELIQLRDELNRHNRLYYAEAAPEISTASTIG